MLFESYQSDLSRRRTKCSSGSLSESPGRGSRIWGLSPDSDTPRGAHPITRGDYHARGAFVRRKASRARFRI